MKTLAALLVLIALPAVTSSLHAQTAKTTPVQADIAQARSTAVQLLKEAREARDSGDFPTAREKLAAALKSLTDSPGSPDDFACIQVLSDIGGTAYGCGDLRLARDALSVVHDYCEKTMPPDSLRLQAARDNLALMMKSLGELKPARALQEQVLAVFERTLPEDDPDLQKTRLNLAATLKAMGEPEAAKVLEDKALAVFERTRPDDDQDLCAVRQNLAVTLRLLGNLDAALVLQHKVLATCESTLPGDDLAVQRARLNLGVLLAASGETLAARPLLEMALAGFERALPEDHPNLLATQQNLATCLLWYGDLPAARALFERVLHTCEATRPADAPELMAARSNLAVVLDRMGDLRGALLLGQESLAALETVFPIESLAVQAARNNLGMTLRRLGQFERARRMAEEDLRVAERTLFEGHPDLQASRMNLGLSLADTGDFPAARTLLEDVLAAAEKTFPPGHPDLEMARSAVADLAHDQGDFERSRALRRRVVDEISSTLPAGHPDQLLMRQALGRTLAAMGRKEELGRLLVELESELSVAVADLFVLGRREAGERVHSLGRTVNALGSLLPLCPNEAALRLPFFVCIEELRVASEMVTSGDAANPETRAAIERASVLRRQVGDLVAGRGVVQELGQDDPKHISDLVRKRDDAEIAVRRLLAARGQPPFHLDVPKIVKALAEIEGSGGGNGPALVVGYRRFEHEPFGAGTPDAIPAHGRLLAHVLDAHGKLTRIDLGPIDAIAAAVTRWRQTIGRPLESGVGTVAQESDAAGESLARGLGAVAPSSAAEPEAGAALRRLVLDPVLAVAPDVKMLVVCVDDVLHLVPLEALPLEQAVPANADGRWVGERCAIRYVTSLARLATPVEATHASPALLAVGGIDYNAEIETEPALDSTERIGSNWGPLPGSRGEVKGIGTLFESVFKKPARVLDGKAATKAALIETLRGASFVHVATHGYFAPESIRSVADKDASSSLWSPMSSGETVTGMAPMTLCGIALAGANRGMDSLGHVPGVLTAEELAGLDLHDCELGVLSACETNVGITRAGQGLQSLQAALHAAGVRTAITSLWRVSDEATRELFEDFYTRIWVGHEQKSVALWHAKMALCKKGRPTQDWAAWVLTGAPN